MRRAFEHFNARNAGSSSDNPDEIEQNGRLGKFRILGKLGEGSFGKVYKAFDQRLSRVVAIKVLHDRFSDGPYDIDYFMREARAAAQFQHPNICTIYDADCVDSRHYIAMAFIDGNSLQEILRDRGHFGPRHAAQVIRDLAGAVHQAHVVPSSKLGSRRSRSLLSFIVGQTDQSLFFVFNP